MHELLIDFQDEILDFSLFGSSGKFVHFPCRNSLKQPLYAGKLLVVSRRDLKQKIFAVPSEKDGAEVGSSSDVLDDYSVVSPEDDESCKSSDVEVMATATGLEEGISQSVENVRNQRNLLDKLKAVRLHILASEQWNASRLDLCHRYSSFS